MWHAWVKTEKCTWFWWENPKERALGRPRRRWEDGIRMDLRKICWECVEWIQQARDRNPVAGCCECDVEPSGSSATELVQYKQGLCHFRQSTADRVLS
jgi:hypothetical protein